MRTIAFFNNKGGVGKTSLVYHLAWMYAELGVRVIAVDLDPQANLSSMLVGEERLEEAWESGRTIVSAMKPLLEGTGDLGTVHVEQVAPRLGAVIGDLELATAETDLSGEWNNCLNGNRRAFRVISLFWRVIEQAAASHDASLALIDVGPNLGSINRAALLAAERVVVPLAPDLFSIQGLRNLGPTLRRWRGEWDDRRARAPDPDLSLPSGEMDPVGYVVMQHAVRLRYPVKAYQKWIERIPEVFHRQVLNEQETPPVSIDADDRCLALLKHYRSLMALAHEAGKPMFLLRSADGAIGSQATAVRSCYADFQQLARTVAERCDVVIPAQGR